MSVPLLFIEGFLMLVQVCSPAADQPLAENLNLNVKRVEHVLYMLQQNRFFAQ